MKKKLFLVVAILVVGVAAAISFAMTQTSASVGLSITPGGGSSFVEVTAAGIYTRTTHHGNLPSWSPIEDTAGGIAEPGDLYFFEPVTDTVDGLAFVYLTNVGDLAKCYSFLNMGLNLWKFTDGATTYTETITARLSDEWLTLSNGYVSFDIDSSEAVTYAITLDEVSWYCIDGNPTDEADESLSPSFYVDVVQK